MSSMDMYEIIKTKRDGGNLSGEQIDFFVKGSSQGTIPDYQITALLMAIFLKGMNKEETFSLTQAMKDSGETLDLSMIDGIKCDKHSTGGVGDKTSLITGPLAAAAGVPVAKMSGRGLGFTGGTIDKLESIPGFQTTRSIDDFIRQVNDHGLCIIGQSAQVAVADKKFYALRDVTATVDNISLIASSIMSKKLALGSDAILLDVKCGQAAFMKGEEQAVSLAELMVEIGRSFGKKTAAIVSSMDQPLGNAVGNSLEVTEAINVLKGEGPEDITEISVTLAGMMIYLSGLSGSIGEACVCAERCLEDGRGLVKLREMIKAQGGDESVTDDPSLLKTAGKTKDVISQEEGFIEKIDGSLIGTASMHSGAGRSVAGEDIDPGAGIILFRKAGDRVEKGEALCRIYSSSDERLEQACGEAEHAFSIGKNKKDVAPLILKKII